MKNRYGDLTQGSIPKHLIRLTLPMAWGIMAIISVQLVDTYFIGLLGAQELIAISFTFPVTLTITHIVFGLTIAMSSVISRLIGANELQTVRRVVLHGVIFAFTVSVILALICYALMDSIFTALGAPPDIQAIIREYMPLWLIGSTLVSIPMNGNSAIRANGDAIKPALVMTLVALTNIILDPILIFGHFGVPAMGVQGAAIASLLGYAAGAMLGLYFLIFDKKLIACDGLHLTTLTDSLKRLSFIAIPAGLTNAIIPLTNNVITAILAGISAEAVAAFGIAGRVEAFCMMLVMALSTAMAPIIGQNWGAKKYPRVHKTINTAILFNLIWCTIVAIILASFARIIGGAFTDNQDIINLTTLYFWIVPFSYGIGNLLFGWSSTFNAIGKPVRSLAMIFTRAFILTVPAVYIGSILFSVPGIFAALAGINLISGALFHWLSRRACIKCEEPALIK